LGSPPGLRYLDYRMHIDGLRAIALLAVVLVHAAGPGFGGGFVGVDVFFVISGYLIIGLLFREFERTGNLSLSGFFERRIRRLGPALVVVLLATLLLSMVFLTPIGGEQQGLAKSVIATVGLVSNLYFAQTTGEYFDGAAELQPLLHTWSLSVEEQFYLFWPLVVLAAGRIALRRWRRPEEAIFAALSGLFVLSLALSVWMTAKYPNWALYLAPTRAWEFAVGGLAYFCLRSRAQVTHAGCLAALGVVAVALSIGLYRESMAFPDYSAALPVLGAAAIIAAAIIVGTERSESGWCRRLLALPALVFLGLLSYAWYLWHWPLLVVARLHTLGELGAWGTGGICLLSLLLAWLTYRLVEEPIRRKRSGLLATRRRAFGFVLVSSAALVFGSALAGYMAKYVLATEADSALMAAALNRLETSKLLGCV